MLQGSDRGTLTHPSQARVKWHKRKTPRGQNAEAISPFLPGLSVRSALVFTKKAKSQVSSNIRPPRDKGRGKGGQGCQPFTLQQVGNVVLMATLGDTMKMLQKVKRKGRETAGKWLNIYYYLRTHLPHRPPACASVGIPTAW
jgi:hypothetical protein